MSKRAVSVTTWAVCALLAIAFTGCAGPDVRTLDVDRLDNAIAMDDVGYVQAAIRSGAVGINQRVPVRGYRAGTPLITIAARAASLNVLQYLISAGADVNARTPANETALMLAAFFSEEDGGGAGSYERHEQAVRMLVKAGANLENDPYNYTPLSYAAYQGHERIVRFLLEHGARVDADAQDGLTYINTPLMMAAMEGRLQSALWLLRAGADARIRLYRGATAADLAAKYHNARLSHILRCAENLAPGERFAGKCE